jgi:hypothetical protein
MQIQDFFSNYQAKRDEELLRLAEDLEQLSPEARFALHGELARRRLEIANAKPEEPLSDSTVKEPDKPSEFVPSQSTASFMSQVLLTYRTHFGGFVRLAFPAVLIGYVITLIAHIEIREIISSFRLGDLTRSHTWQYIEIGLLNLTAAFVSWLGSCISFGAIAFVTREAAEHRPFPSFSASLSKACDRIGSLFRLAVVLFVAALVGGVALTLFWSFVIFFVIRLRTSQFDLALRTTLYILIGLGMVVFSRVWVAIPAFVLDHCRVGESLFRSDERTQGQWLKLAALVAKSLVAGYIAAALPFWLAAWATAGVPQPWWLGWVLDALAVVGVSTVEPLLFIGFSLIYLQGATPLNPEPASPKTNWAGASSA